jgi:hypothetical protein
MNDVETSKLDADVRAGAAAYGRFIGSVLGIVVCSLTLFLSVPIVMAIVCVGLGPQLACLAVVILRRTRLPLMAAPAVTGAVGCAVQIYVSIQTVKIGNVGRPQNLADLTYLWPMAATAAAIPLLILAAWWWHRDQWNVWKVAVRDCSVTDMLLFRHVPDLRQGRTNRILNSQPPGQEA